jgi:hypothetical protein
MDFKKYSLLLSSPITDSKIDDFKKKFSTDSTLFVEIATLDEFKEAIDYWVTDNSAHHVFFILRLTEEMLESGEFQQIMDVIERTIKLSKSDESASGFFLEFRYPYETVEELEADTILTTTLDLIDKVKDKLVAEKMVVDVTNGVNNSGNITNQVVASKPLNMIDSQMNLLRNSIGIFEKIVKSSIDLYPDMPDFDDSNPNLYIPENHGDDILPDGFTSTMPTSILQKSEYTINNFLDILNFLNLQIINAKQD